MAGLHIAEGADEAAADMGNLLGQLFDQSLHPLPLEVVTAGDRAGTGDDGEGVLAGQSDQLLFLDIDKGTNDRLATVVGKKFWTHGREAADIELVEQECLDKVIKMMAEGDLVTAQTLSDFVEGTATQAGAKSAIRSAGAAFFFDDAVAFGLFHVIGETVLLQVIFDDIGAITGVVGIDIDRDQFIMDRRVPAQGIKGVKESIRIFPSRDADSNPVPGFDELKIADRFSG